MSGVNLVPLTDEEREALHLLPALVELLRTQRATPSADKALAPRRILTVPQVCKLYGIGRNTIIDLIRSGKLRAVTRRMPGGREGFSLRVEDCDRVIGGVP